MVSQSCQGKESFIVSTLGHLQVKKTAIGRSQYSASLNSAILWKRYTRLQVFSIRLVSSLTLVSVIGRLLKTYFEHKMVFKIVSNLSQSWKTVYTRFVICVSRSVPMEEMIWNILSQGETISQNPLCFKTKVCLNLLMALYGKI